MPHVLEGITVTLANEESSSLEWEDVQFMHEDGIVVITGNIQLAVGDAFKLDNGKQVTVTEENVDSFRRVIRVGIPLEIAQEGNVDDVIGFLDGKKQKNYLAGDELTEQPETTIGQAPTDDPAQTVNGFDLEGLTDDQIRQLMLSPTPDPSDKKGN